MSAHTTTAPPIAPVSRTRPAERLDAEADRDEGIQQYSFKKILAVWAAAALPMGVLAWVIAPLSMGWFSGSKPPIQSLLVWLTAGLIWRFGLVLILVRRKTGSFGWPRLRDALWLRPPRDPKTKARRRHGVVVGASVLPRLRRLGDRAVAPDSIRHGLPSSSSAPTAPSTSSAARGMVRRDRRDVGLQHRARRGNAVPRTAAPAQALRAVGMTRRQIRRMIPQESVVTALIRAALGLPLGVFLAALITHALSDQRLTFALPVDLLIGFIIVAVVAGLTAAIFPARRASRLNVLKALQYE